MSINEKLIDVSINTMIGNLPQIMNKNNQYVCEEFDSIRQNNRVILDVSAANISANNANFNSINIGGTIINSTTLPIYARMNNSITELKSSVEELKSSSITRMSVPMTYSAASEKDSYDMSSFFSTAVKGILENITINELYDKKLYRIVEGLKIPLNIGTVVSGSKIKLTVYHDHIDTTGSTKIVERIYSTIMNSADGKSVVQFGSADTVILNVR